MVGAAYGRVSTDKKDQLNSLENQFSYFNREITAHGHELFAIYLDKGLTGTWLNNRPEFDRMLTDAGIDIKVLTDDKRDGRKCKKHTVYELSDRKPKFDEVWIKNTSRFARNTLSYEIISLLRQKGVNIYFIEQNINTKDVSQDFMLKLMQVFDEGDSKDKSLKVRSGNQEGAKKNVVRTNSKLYGYKYIQTENRLVVIPEEASVVNTIFGLYSKGNGTRAICRILTEMNIFTRSGKSFATNTISGILDNEKYAGLNNPLKLDTGVVFEKYSTPKTRDSYIVMECDRIPPIISTELFYKCRNELEKRVSHTKKQGIYVGLSKYANLLWCKKCGQKYYSNQKGNNAYYVCKTKRIYGVEACKSPNVYVKEIDKEIAKLVDRDFIVLFNRVRNVAVDRIISKIEQLLLAAKGESSKCESDIEQKIIEIKERLESYYELYTNTRSNRCSIKNKIDMLEIELDELTSEIDGIKLSETEIKEQIKSYLNNLYIYTKDCQFTSNEILSMIDKIVVREVNGKPKFEYTITIFGELKVNSEDTITLPNEMPIDRQKVRRIEKEALIYAYGNAPQ